MYSHLARFPNTFNSTVRAFRYVDSPQENPPSFGTQINSLSQVYLALPIVYLLTLSNMASTNKGHLCVNLNNLENFQAVVRFGTSSAPLNRGEVVPGTYCSRNFYECYRQRCRLQSPNYPGMYPRNVTCYLTLKQKELPTCKHALITVSQTNSKRIQIKVNYYPHLKKFHLSYYCAVEASY